MKNKKLYAALVAGTLAVSMMGTTVLAAAPTASGDTDFIYNSGWVGPVDPVDPGTEDTNPNNWMVNYPKTIELTEDNLETEVTNAATAGKALNFVVKQRVPGASGTGAVTADNVGAGISVKPSAAEWTSGTAITMTGSAGSVVMSLANSDSSAFLNPDEEMLRLTHTVTTDDGYAVVTDNSAAEDGVTYTKTVKFTFTRETN